MATTTSQYNTTITAGVFLRMPDGQEIEAGEIEIPVSFRLQYQVPDFR